MYLIKKLHPTICALIAILLAACAPVEKKWDIVWPLPPEEPRIKYVGILRSSLDVEKPGGLMKALVGPDSIHVLKRPYGIATDKEGRVYVSDMGRVFVFDRKNRKFSLIEANCIGWCHKAPAMLINDTPYTELTPEKVTEILREYIRK